MKKKYVAIFASMVLSAFMITGGTLAYFTSEDSVTNTAKADKIEIEIEETYNPPETVVPGDTVEKIVNIDNIGGDAFIRVSVEKQWTSDDLISELDTSNIQFEVLEGWQKIDDYYYVFVSAGETSPTFMESFTFVNGDNDNDYQNLTANIIINAEAIQTRNGAMESEWGIAYNSETGTFSKVTDTI